MRHSEVSAALAERGFMASPDAVETILGHPDPEKCISLLAVALDPTKTLVITPDHVRRTSGWASEGAVLLVSQDAAIPPAVPPQPIPSERVLAAVGPAPAVPVDAATPPAFDVLGEITGSATCQGVYSEFVEHFQDRYRQLSTLLRDRVSPMPIEAASRLPQGKETVAVLGMVGSAETTKNGHLLLELEDLSGTLKVLVGKDSPLRCIQLLCDEVVAVRGRMTSKGLFIAESIDLPDVEVSGPTPAPPVDACVALTSDLHIGSREFMEDQFIQFVDVLAGRERLPRSNGSMERVRYLLVAGDLVDGVGVYPNQHADLGTDDVVEQYRAAARLFRRVPPHVAVFICPGNHDAVRQAEPQPALPERFRDGFPPNVHFVSNPSRLSLGGHRVVMYHGRSVDDLVAKLPGVTYQKPVDAIRELLRRRHLSPLYGGRVHLAPQATDQLVLSEVPHILQIGHTHTHGIGEYRGVKLVNAGCWQAQTDFQRRMNIQPDPAKVAVVDLAGNGVSVFDFLN